MLSEEVVIMYLLVVDGVLVHVMIRVFGLERFQASPDLGGLTVAFQINWKSIKIGLKPETDKWKEKNAPGKDEDFTTKPRSAKESSQADSDSEDTLVIALARDASERVFE